MTIALPLAFGFVNLPTAQDDCTCDTPTNVRRTSSTATSITYSWDAVSGATGYNVKYLRLSDSYQSPEWTTTATSYTFTNLTAGAYKFYFATDCGGEVSEFIVIEDVSGT